MSWNNEDRRVKLQELREDFIKFKATIEEWTKNTTEYRKCQSEKIDKIIASLGLLPCKERSGFYQSIGNQIKVLWGFTGAIALAIIYDWIKNRK